MICEVEMSTLSLEGVALVQRCYGAGVLLLCLYLNECLLGDCSRSSLENSALFLAPQLTSGNAEDLCVNRA